MLSSVVQVVGVSPASANATYSQTVTLPVPPASSFAGNSGGDGWDVSLDQDRVYNVYHHQTNVFFACQKQADASKCGELYPKAITDDGATFSTSNYSGTHLDQSNGRLYTYGVRDDMTAGVVCIDTNSLDTDPNPFCGFTELTAIGSADAGSRNLGSPLLVDNKLFAVSYRDPVGSILCFEVATESACANQPYSSGLPFGNNYSTSAIDGRLMMQTGNSLECFDTTTLAQCTGAWPVTTEARGPAPFPHLDTSGSVTGVCVPNGARSCFDLDANPILTPTGMAAAIPRTSGPSGLIGGPSVVIGTRVYVVDPLTSLGDASNVGCYDYNTSAACLNFPITFSGGFPGLHLLYTINADPYRPSCIWVNGDNGDKQIQAFDAYSGEACGDGPIRVLASQFVVDDVDCFPTAYQSLELIQPTPADYDSASVEFLNGAGGLTGIADQLFSSGVVDLTLLDLESEPVLPQFLISLTSPTAAIGEVVLKLTWSDEFDPACTGPDTEIEPEPTSVDPAITGAGQTGNDVTVAEGESATASALLTGDNAAVAGGTVTYTWYSDAACTTVASQGSGQIIVTAGELPDSESVNLAVGTYYVVAGYSGDDINEASASACGDAVLTVESLNEAPEVEADAASVTTPEGTDSVMNGTFSDPDGDAVTLTLSPNVGAIVDNLNGTWTWSAAAPDGPAGPYTVTVTADDGNGETASTSFEVSVTNVAPNVDAGPDLSITFGGVATLAASFGDPGADADWTVDIDWGDGAVDSSAAASTGAIGDSHQYLILGEHTVEICVTDKDGATGCDTLTVTVSNTLGKVTGGVSTIDGDGTGGFVVQHKNGKTKGSLQFQDDATNFHANEMTALAVSEDETSAWFAGVGKDGRNFVAYVEDNGEPGVDDIFRLWIEGVLHGGTGVMEGGNIQIH